MKKHLIHFNSPVILGMTILSFALLLVSMATQGMLNNALAVRYTGWGDPLMYIRLFTMCSSTRISPTIPAIFC